MIPFKSPLQLTVPPTLEKRLEALTALRTLQAQDEELYRRRWAEIAALRRDLEELQRVFATFCRHFASERSEILRLLKYSPDQPRVPAGQSGGGQWTSEGGSGASNDSIASIGGAETSSVIQPAGSAANPHIAQIPPLLFENPLFFARPPFAEFPKDPKLPPGPGYEWRGQSWSKPGDPEGSWYNPKTGESLHPDMNHPPPIGPHWDYIAPDEKLYRWFPDGRLELSS